MHHQWRALCDIRVAIWQITLITRKLLFCYRRYLSALSFPTVFSTAALCFLSKLMAHPLMSSQVHTGENSYAWEPTFLLPKQIYNCRKCSESLRKQSPFPDGGRTRVPSSQFFLTDHMVLKNDQFIRTELHGAALQVSFPVSPD